MPELRWALLVLGVLVVAGIYFYSRRRANNGADDMPGGRAEPSISGEDIWGDDDTGPQLDDLASPTAHRRAAERDRAGSNDYASPARSGVESPRKPRERTEPVLGAVAVDDDVPQPEDASHGQEPDIEATPETAAEGPPPDPDRIVAMRVSAPQGRTFQAETLVLKLRELGLRHGRYKIFHKHVGDGEGRPIFSVASMVEPGSFDLTRLKETDLPGVSIFMVLPGPGDPVETFDEMVSSARELARELDGELLDESGSTWSIQRERYVREELIRYRLYHGRG